MSDPAISAATIAAAEKLLGVSYTDAERQLMLDNLLPQMELTARRRLLALPTGLGPATRFDPRLPGFRLPSAVTFHWQPQDAAMPNSDEDIAFASVASLAGWIRSRKISSERLTRIYLETDRTI